MSFVGKSLLPLLALVVFGTKHALAVVTGTTTFQADAPTSATVANWGPVSSSSSATAWDYIGQVNGASAVYLGNNWVLTAGHVGANDFTLAEVTYSILTGSAQTFGSADLTLFQITTSPDLPALTISSSAPSTGSISKAADNVVLIGYGGGTKAWGQNAASGTNFSVDVSGFVTTDFYTVYGTYTVTYHQGPWQVTRTYNNSAQVIGGDSGGGDFIYNSTSGHWELAGLNEARDDNSNSYLVQLSTYKTAITNAMANSSAVPEPGSVVFLSFGAVALLRRRR